MTKHVQTHSKKQFCLIRTDRQRAVTETEVRNYLFLVTEAVTGEAQVSVRPDTYWLLGHTAFQTEALGNGGNSEMHLASLPFVK